MAIAEDELSKRTIDALDAWSAGLSLAARSVHTLSHSLVARINIPFNKTSPKGLIEANTFDPWRSSGKYALGWVYFGIILLVGATVIHVFHAFTDRIRTAIHEEELLYHSNASSPDDDYELPALTTGRSTTKFFPAHGELPKPPPTAEEADAFSGLRRPINFVIALFRYFFYRPIPALRWHKGFKPIEFPSLSVLVLATVALAFVCLYTFVPQPLYWKSLAFGAPPVAVRSGMLAVSLMPWIIAMAMKANLVTFLTGIGHERLNVLHRWMAYLCLLLGLIHTVPFYIQPMWDAAGNATYQNFLNVDNYYVYGSGIAALVPLIFLCIQSLPLIRHKAYELFVTLHVPVSIVFTGMLFWHCHNYLSSWSYLYATIAIWAAALFGRIFFLNWLRPWRMSWLVGEDASVTILPEDAVKVTIPSQMSWRPGQYVYLRMPGISFFENHPFTIASLCSDEFPSEYGEDYRDMILVFRPFGGFTKKVFESGINRGPYHVYRAFVDGPYGGMRRSLASFDHVVMVAGGSGITAIVSQLLDLIKRMRDGKAITKSVRVIWALKRPETMEWFKEELRICREYAPPDSVRCQFYITAAKQPERRMPRMTGQGAQKHLSAYLHDRVDAAFNGVVDKRASWHSKRNSALIREEAAGDVEMEKALKIENEDTISPLPQAHIVSIGAGQTTSPISAPLGPRNFSRPTSRDGESNVDSRRNLGDDLSNAVQPGNIDSLDPKSQQTHPQYQHQIQQHRPLSGRNQEELLQLDTKFHHDNTLAQLTSPTPTSATTLLNSTFSPISAPPSAITPTAKQGAFIGEEEQEEDHYFDESKTASNQHFGFPSTPTEFQKNLMRFAFLPAAARGPVDGWTTEYGRPDLPYMLKEMSQAPEFGRRTAFFVCGPAEMRVSVARAVAGMQSLVLGGKCEEVFLHTENYAL